MRGRGLTAVVVILAGGGLAAACSFCGDGFARRQPLRAKYADAKVVIAGTLRNPKPDASGLGGTTEFHVATVLKDDPARNAAAVIVIPRYLPAIGTTPPEYLFFFDVADGKLEPSTGVEGGTAAAAYLKGAAALTPSAADRGLGFFFKHLDSPDPTVSADAFTEFARATDAELAKAVARFDRLKLRAWLADANTPNERVGVYAMLLGLCGTADDAAWLNTWLAETPRPERVSANLGGLLAGLIQLDPAAGWTHVQAALAAADRPFTEKLSVIGTLRYVQATRGADAKPRLLAAYRTLVETGDLADLAIDDLRRFGWWDLADVAFAQFGKPTHKTPAVRRGIVRFALACPTDAAKAFVAAARAADPKLMQQVEDARKLYETPKK